MRTLKRVITSVALLGGVIAVAAPVDIAEASAPVRPAVTTNSWTDCSQSAFLGARICFDDTTGYGPVALVYTSGTTVSWAEGSTIGCSMNGVSAFAATIYEASVTSDGIQVPGWVSAFDHFPIPCSGTFMTFSTGFVDILQYVVGCYCGYEVVHVR